jgi:hypothetical protein
MDRRTLNRKTEHSKEGHLLSQVEPEGKNLPKTNRITGSPIGMFSCTCGWAGWLDLK